MSSDFHLYRKSTHSPLKYIAIESPCIKHSIELQTFSIRKSRFTHQPFIKHSWRAFLCRNRFLAFGKRHEKYIPTNQTKSVERGHRNYQRRRLCLIEEKTCYQISRCRSALRSDRAFMFCYQKNKITVPPPYDYGSSDQNKLYKYHSENLLRRLRTNNSDNWAISLRQRRQKKLSKENDMHAND